MSYAGGLGALRSSTLLPPNQLSGVDDEAVAADCSAPVIQRHPLKACRTVVQSSLVIILIGEFFFTR
jgi:hypothetical protein